MSNDFEKCSSGEKKLVPDCSLTTNFPIAVMKALGVGLGGVRFREIEVIKDPSGRPSLTLHGNAAQLAADTGIRHWHLSLSHTSSVAEALVIAE